MVHFVNKKSMKLNNKLLTSVLCAHLTINQNQTVPFRYEYLFKLLTLSYQMMSQ